MPVPYRLPPIPEHALTADQRRVRDAIVSGPRGGARGPFDALLRSPELADRVQHLGAYVRFASALPKPLSEIAILVTARHWSAQYEWYAHRALALKAGVAPAVIDAIAAGRRPRGLAREAAAVHDFARALHARKFVTDAQWRAAVGALGEQGAVDLVATCGYYALVAMTLNVAGVPLPEGVRPLAPVRPEARSPTRKARRKPARAPRAAKARGRAVRPGRRAR